MVMFLVLLTVFIFQLIRFPRVSSLVDDLVVIMFWQQNFSDTPIDIINS